MSDITNAIIAMEKKWFTIELIYPSGTGYDTAIKSMPKEVALLDYCRRDLGTGLIGGSEKHIFTFLALEKSKSENISITFQQIRIFAPDEPGEEVKFNVIIHGKGETSFEDNFINYSANTAKYEKHGTDVCPATDYGFPSNCMNKYGYLVTPYGYIPNNDCIMKYGYNSHLYGYPINDNRFYSNHYLLKYGYPGCSF